MDSTYTIPHCEKTSLTPCLNVPEYATSLFSASNTVTFVTSVSVALGWRATRLRTVADADVADGKKGGEMMTR